jgi:hypothetical protein
MSPYCSFEFALMDIAFSRKADVNIGLLVKFRARLILGNRTLVNTALVEQTNARVRQNGKSVNQKGGEPHLTEEDKTIAFRFHNNQCDIL